jgi:hypothetical protein
MQGLLRGGTISHRLFAHSCPLLTGGPLHLQCAGGGSGRRALLEVEPRLEHQQLVGQARAEPGGPLSGAQLWLTTGAGCRQGVLKPTLRRHVNELLPCEWRCCVPAAALLSPTNVSSEDWCGGACVMLGVALTCAGQRQQL